MLDCNGVELRDSDFIDIHQAVNGQSEFIVITVDPLEIVYAYDHTRKYEYDKEALLAPCRFTGEVDWEIIGSF